MFTFILEKKSYLPSSIVYFNGFKWNELGSKTCTRKFGKTNYKIPKHDVIIASRIILALPL
jgi:hypothetical protein